MVIARPTWRDLSSTPQTVFGSWYAVGIHSENAPWGKIRTLWWPVVQIQGYIWQLLQWSSRPSSSIYWGEKGTFSLVVHCRVHTFVLTVSIKVPSKDVTA